MYNYIKIVLLNVLIPMENWPLELWREEPSSLTQD